MGGARNGSAAIGSVAAAVLVVVTLALSSGGCTAFDVSREVGKHRPLTSKDPLDRAVHSAGMAGATLGGVVGVPASMPLLPLTAPIAWATGDEDVMLAPATLVSATVGVAAGAGAFALTLPLRGARWVAEVVSGGPLEVPSAASSGAPASAAETEAVEALGWIEPMTPDDEEPAVAELAALDEGTPVGPLPTLSGDAPAPAIVAPQATRASPNR